jgi:hypothetical protein
MCQFDEQMCRCADVQMKRSSVISHRYCPPSTVNCPPVIGQRSSVNGHRSTVIGQRSTVIGQRSSVNGHRYCHPSTVNCPPVIGQRSSVNGHRYCPPSFNDYNISTIVPPMISSAPSAVFQVSVSPRKTTDRTIVSATLSLSTGATWDTFPNCIALK